MKFSCDQCNTQYMIADEKVGSRGVKVRCKKCTHLIVVQGSGVQADATAAAAASEPPAAITANLVEGIGSALTFGDEDRTTENATPLSVIAPPSTSTPHAAEFTSEQEVSSRVAAQRQNAQSAGSPDAGKVWFVAVGEGQLGPLNVAEVQKRWASGELNANSLTWCAGMSDWIPLADVAEFAAWVAQRRSTAPVSTPAAPAPAPEVTWKPSAASALSSLMQEELLAAAAPKPVAKEQRPAGLPDLDFLAGGSVGNVFAPAGSAQSTAASAVRQESPGGGGVAWAVPAPHKRSLHAGAWAMIGGVVVAVAGLGFFVLRNQPLQGVQLTQKAMPTAVAPPGTAAQVMSSTPQPTAQAGGQAVQQPSAPDAGAPVSAPAVVAQSPSPTSAKWAPAQGAAGQETGEEESLRRNAGRARRVRERERPTAHATTAPPSVPAVPVKASLGKEDIWSVVRQSASRVAPCLKAARARNEMPAGKYTFILDWTIRPDGAVVDAHLKGPPEVLSTSLVSCFSASMMQWRFAASQTGAPIANFPFGPVNVP